MIYWFCHLHVLKEDPSQDIDEVLEDDNISDILLWAIFANRKELAEICWLRSKNHLCKFLTEIKNPPKFKI